VVGSDDGLVYVLSLADGRQLWSYEIGRPIKGAAAVVEGRFVIGADDGVLYCFGAR
jgi:outer membrane protein assembly factor BamB